MSALRVIASISLGLVVILVAISALVAPLLVDALWFGSLGYASVFRTMLGARVACFFAAFGIALAVVMAAGLSAVQPPGGALRVVLRREGNGDAGATIPELIAPISDRIPWKTLIALASAVVSGMFAAGQAANWETWLLFLNGSEVGVNDPLLGHDAGFYLFTLPVLRLLMGGLFALLVLAGIIAATVFWLQGALDLRRSGGTLSKRVISLGSLLIGLALLVKAGDYMVGRYELLLTPSGAVFGAGYTAANLRLPILSLLAIVAGGGALACFANLWRRSWQLPAGAIVAVVGFSILSSVLPNLFQRLRVRPDELRLERPYLEHNIAMTRFAYGLNAIESRPFPALGKLDASAIERNQETFSNVRLWDPKPLLDTYRQLQVIRLYYDFHDIDIDRYDLPGGRRQVMLGAREIVPDQLPANARTWVNQKLQFTHGFGIVMSPVTEFVGEGLPALFVKDIPPRSDVGLEIDEPRIYYGERTSDYVLVNGAAAEFDYPKGDQNVTNTYDGRGGVLFGSIFRRMLFAWTLRDVNLLISGQITSESRILFRRLVQERISTIAPFLRLDSDPYVVVSEGHVYWIQDAYTTSSTFPYSEPLQEAGLNYVRNPVKIVVNAYHGSVDFFMTDPDEPVLASYAKIFPDLFRPIDEMRADLRKHVRYPENLFRIQSEMYRTYHMTNPDVFYNKEDLWTFANETVDGEQKPVEPYYVIMKLPGEEKAEFLLMQPMTPSNRNNMVAWVAARCDSPHYGELVEFGFPKERLIYGPQQIEARIDQDTVISQQLSLWDQMGSRVIRGNLLVIPVEDSIVYIEPLFLRSEQGQIPELKRVIASYGDRVAMEPTLEAALAAVFGGPAPAPIERPRGLRAPLPDPAAPEGGGAPSPDPSIPAAEPADARDHYRAALQYLRAGDWVEFGRAMDTLGQSLGQ